MTQSNGTGRRELAALSHLAGASERDFALKRARSKVEKNDTTNLRIQNFSYYAPTAKSVQLTGDFTGWLERPIDMRRGSEGVWQIGVRLEVGTRYYRFLVDGEWHDDPECARFVPNPFGSTNAVRQVV